MEEINPKLKYKQAVEDLKRFGYNSQVFSHKSNSEFIWVDICGRQNSEISNILPWGKKGCVESIIEFLFFGNVIFGMRH